MFGLYFTSGFELISLRKRGLFVLLLLQLCSWGDYSYLCLFLTMSWVSLQCVTVAFIGHIHLLCVLFCCVVLCVLSRLPITSLGKREVDAN